MNIAWIAVGGFSAHALGHLLAQYANWLFAKIERGESQLAFWADLQCFLRWLLHNVAGHFSDRRAWAPEDHGWPHDLHGN